MLLKMYNATYETSSQIILDALLHSVYYRLAPYFSYNIIIILNYLLWLDKTGEAFMHCAGVITELECNVNLESLAN